MLVSRMILIACEFMYGYDKFVCESSCDSDHTMAMQICCHDFQYTMLWRQWSNKTTNRQVLVRIDLL